MGRGKAIRVRHPRRVVARRDRGYKSVMRPTRWGNPYRVDEDEPGSRARALRRYERWLERKLDAVPDFLEALRGYNLGCTCRPDLACHADILLRRLYGGG